MKVCQTSGAQLRRRPSRWAAAIALFLMLLALFAAPAHAEKVEQLPQPQGYVNDFAGVIDAASAQQLTQLCQEVDTKADAQIAVVTIHTLEGDTAQDFANRLFQKWGVGPKGKDRGLMILLAVDDHQYWTEVGYGLEPILPDGKVGGFGRQMLPILRQNQYGAALLQITSQVAGVIAQDRNVSLTQAAPAPQQSDDDQNQTGFPPQAILLLVFFFIFFGWRVLAFILGLFGVTRFRRGMGSRGGWWMGPMGGGFGGGGGGSSWGGGGGFGGFGGGMSGGGGAGGGW